MSDPRTIWTRSKAKAEKEAKASKMSDKDKAPPVHSDKPGVDQGQVEGAAALFDTGTIPKTGTVHKPSIVVENQEIAVLKNIRIARNAAITHASTEFYEAAVTKKLTKRDAQIKLEFINQLNKECSDLTHQIVAEMEKALVPTDLITAEMMKDEERLEKLAQLKVIFKDFYEKSNQTSSDINVASPSRILQPLNLQVFDGDYANFPRWYSIFKALVDSTSQPAIVKFTYLQNSLEPSVLDSIAHITFDEDHYKDALASLKEQYDRPLLIQERVIEGLIEYPVITHNYAKNLRGLLERCRSSLTTLKMYGFDKNSNGIFIICLLRQKLPSPIKRQWALKLKEIETLYISSREMQKDILDIFLEFLDSQTTGEEAAYDKPNKASPRKPLKPITKKPTMTFNAQVNQQSKRKGKIKSSLFFL